MSKKNHNKPQNNNNMKTSVVENTVNEEVGVTPIEGDNSIDETEVQDEETPVEGVVTELEEEVSQVAESQESEEELTEDRPATIEEEIEEPEVVEEVTYVEELQEEEIETEESVPEKGFYFSLGSVKESKMEEVKKRLVKAGVDDYELINDEIVVGPFETRDEALSVRREIIKKGLKARIIEL